MKKVLLALVLAASLLVMMAACGSETADSSKAAESSKDQSVSSEVSKAGSSTPISSAQSEAEADSNDSSPQIGSSAVSTPQDVLDLSGEWKQVDGNSNESYQAAYITDSSIEIYWVMDGGNTISLYWAGTCEIPTDGSDSFTWESVNDTTKTAGAMLASSDSSKKFTYKDGQISYSASAMGVTTTVRLEKGGWGYSEKLG